MFIALNPFLYIFPRCLRNLRLKIFFRVRLRYSKLFLVKKKSIFQSSNLIIAVALLCAPATTIRADESRAINIIVLDPLALPLSCTCVEGTGQRRYDILADYLTEKLGRPVKVTFEESVGLAIQRTRAYPHLIVGKRSIVSFDADKQGIAIRPVADLTGKNGTTTLQGIFLVDKDDPSQKLADLKGKRIALGPKDQADTHRAAKEDLASAGILEAVTLIVFGSIDAAAIALTDGDVDAAVISDFMPVLLEGCGKIEPGTTRILARTQPVPFITIFATDIVSSELEQSITNALKTVSHDKKLLHLLESKSGFVDPAPLKSNSSSPTANEWADWRGPDRAGYSPHIPRQLTQEKPKPIWSASLTGPAIAGPAVTADFVVVPDKSADLTRDIFRCFDASTGKQLWTIEYDAPKEVDYSNAPRATPVINGDLVYLQGTLGHLIAADLKSGKIVWQKNIFTDFGADLLTWGASIPPLIVDNKLIITPGAPNASVVALDRFTGKTIWRSPGHAAAYSAFIVGVFGGTAQIIGYDTASLGGWDPNTGERLWEHIPPDASDFNVTTPLVIDGRQLLLATENNGARLHSFDNSGRLISKPAADNFDMAPDTCSPVVVNGKIFATAYGELFCVDLRRNLEIVFQIADDMFYDHSNIIAGPDRILIWTISGDLLLVDAAPEMTEYRVIAHWRPFGDEPLDTMAHPAITPGRIYLRSEDTLICLPLE